MKMAVSLTRLLALFSVFCVLVTTAGTTTIVDVKKWATKVGDELSKFFKDATHYEKLQEGYRSPELSLTKKNGTAIAKKMTRDLENVLREKIASIKNLAAKTEELRKNYTYNPSLKDTDYFNSKELKGLPLAIDDRFSPNIKINISSSVVHIPTDVYSGGVGIVNTIKWTSGLDKYFKENEMRKHSLLWQYFGSADGVYRVYPGFEWTTDSNQDIFDHRRRGWYIQGSSSPKDIVLILDLSGSMAGQKLSILKLAALSLLDTLQENDFVNIVAVYNEEPVMVCQLTKDENIIDTGPDCKKELLQATAQNKKFLQYFIPKNAFAKGIARASKGFELAIKVLQDSRKKPNSSSSNCTQAVILFTDGIEKSESKNSKNVLKENNPNKKIRVFTYLVGSEKGATDGPLKEICNDNRGCLFKIQTLSDVREKVLSYVSVLSRPLGFVPGGPDPSWTPIYLDRLGLGLMITLVAPVFNISENKGELLGVVGTDVALPQLERSIPGSEVGVNGYGFAINNNGFVLFHPGLDKEKDPPNIALNELEYNGDKARELMRKMIGRSTGNMSFENRLLFADKHRLSFTDRFHYFYSPVANTSFSAAVAIPELGLYALNASSASIDVELLKTAKEEDVIIAPWEICPDTPVAAESTTPVYEPAYANATDIINDKNFVTEHCDISKLKNLLFDANVTRKVAERWDANENTENKVHSVFAGTHGGIMRLLTTESTTPFPSRDYIKEQFYTQAAQYANNTKGDNQTIVFSTPFKMSASGYQPEVNETIIITASSPVVLKMGANSVVAAVAGMRFDQEKMRDTFLDAIDQNICNSSKDCFIRLIDDDGFILATNQPDDTEVGKFFGLWEGAVLKEFLNQSLFDDLTFTNVQGECKKPEQGASSARKLLNPLFAVTSYVQFWTQTVFWSLMQFNIYSFFSRGNTALAADEEQKVPCTQKLRFYKGNRAIRTIDKPENCPDEDCAWPVFMAPVEGTNLRLVMVRRLCSCEENKKTKLTTKPEDILPSMPVPSNVSYRKPPEFKSPCDDTREEGKPPCALGSLASPQSLTVVFLLVVALLIPCNSHWR